MKCNMDCLNCVYEDCINDDDATNEELSQINKSSKSEKEYATSKKHRDSMKRYRESHKEELAVYMKEYAKGNEVIKAYMRNYYQEHKDEWKPRTLTPEQRKKKMNKPKNINKVQKLRHEEENIKDNIELEKKQKERCQHK